MPYSSFGQPESKTTQPMQLGQAVVANLVLVPTVDDDALAQLADHIADLVDEAVRRGIERAVSSFDTVDSPAG